MHVSKFEYHGNKSESEMRAAVVIGGIEVKLECDDLDDHSDIDSYVLGLLEALGRVARQKMETALKSG
jgi:hypothetical protein